MLPRRKRRQKGSQAGLLSGDRVRGSSTLPGAVHDTVTVLCVLEWPSIKQSFFFFFLPIAIIKCFPGNFSTLTKSRPLHHHHHTILSKPGMILLSCLPFSYHVPRTLGF